MDKLTESLIKHLCPTCCGECDKGLVIIKTKDTMPRLPAEQGENQKYGIQG